MKRNGLILAVAVALAFVLGASAVPQTALAQGPGGAWASGITCVNVGTTDGTSPSITFYDQNGTAKATVTKTPADFKPNVPWLLFTPAIGGLGGSFTGSGIVSSDVATACAVNTQTTGGTTRVGTSEGVSANDTGEKLFATQVMNDYGGFNTYVAVQNASASATNVVAEYFDRNGASVKTLPAVSIPGNASHIFYQDDGSLSSNFLGSATFTSQDASKKLAGAVGMYNKTSAQLLSVNTFTAGAPKVFIPRLVKNISNYGYTSGWTCQNLGPGPSNMTLELTFVNQETQQTVTQTLQQNGVAQGQSWFGYMGAVPNPIGQINLGYGSGIVTSSGGLIACTVNEDVRASNRDPRVVGQGSTYAGMPSGEESNKVSFTQVVALGPNSYRGGFQYANTTGNPATCTHTYFDPKTGNSATRSNVPLAPNSSNSIFAEAELSNLSLDQNSFNGSAEVVCNQPIVGIYNLSIIGESASGDPFATNNGINK